MDNSSGFLVPIRDPYAMAKKIIQVSELSSDKKRLIKDNARRIIEKKCSEKIMIQGMLELYKDANDEK